MGGRSKSGKPGEMPKGGGGKRGWLTMGWSGNSPGGLGSHSQLLPVRNPGL